MLAELTGIDQWIAKIQREGVVYNGTSSHNGMLKIPAEDVYKRYLHWRKSNAGSETASRITFGHVFIRQFKGVRTFQQRLPSDISPTNKRVRYYVIPQTRPETDEILDL